jgi:hypothetical protein
VHLKRAPRRKKRFSCELHVKGARHTGIALDVSATGLFIQTNVKPSPGTFVELCMSLPGVAEPVTMQARVARKKAVPPQLLTLAQGGIGLHITRPSEAYLDFIAEMSPEHAEAAAKERAKAARPRGARPSGAGARGAKAAGRPGGAGGASGAGGNGESAAKRFRIHAVESSSGRKSTFLASCATEAEASEQVLAQLGDEWKVLFIERV